jgi:hypothetical protein
VPSKQDDWFRVKLSPNDDRKRKSNNRNFGAGYNPFSDVGNWMGTPFGTNGNHGMKDLMEMINKGDFPWGIHEQMGMKDMMEMLNKGNFPFGPGMGASPFSKGMNGFGGHTDWLGFVNKMFGSGSSNGKGGFFF